MRNAPRVATPQMPRESERDLFDFARHALRHWPIIFVAMVAGLVIGIGLTAVIPLKSVARIVVAPLADKDDALNAADQGRTTLTVGNLLGGRTPPEIESYFSTIQSMDVVRALLRTSGVAQDLFPDRWDAQTGQWRVPTGIVAESSAKLRSWLGLPPRLPPDDPTVIRAILLGIVSFQPLNKDFAPLTYELDVKLGRPDQALALLTALHNEALAEIRQRALERTRALVDTLHKLYGETQVQDYKETLSRLIADQEQRLMLLQNPSYPVAVEVVDPPAIITPLQRSLTLWAVAGAGSGVLFTITLLFLIWLRNWGDNEEPLFVPLSVEKSDVAPDYRAGSVEQRR